MFSFWAHRYTGRLSGCSITKQCFRSDLLLGNLFSSQLWIATMPFLFTGAPFPLFSVLSNVS